MKEFWLSFSFINFLIISLFKFVCYFIFGCFTFKILGQALLLWFSMFVSLLRNIAIYYIIFIHKHYYHFQYYFYYYCFYYQVYCNYFTIFTMVTTFILTLYWFQIWFPFCHFFLPKLYAFIFCWFFKPHSP